MTIQELGSIGEFTSAVVVVISLLYLAAQVRHATSVARAQSKRDLLYTYSFFTAFHSPDVRDVYRRGIADFASLSNDDKLFFHAVLHPFANQVNAVFETHREGLINEDVYAAWRGALLSHLATTGGGEWWDDAKLLFSTEFVAEFDRLREQHTGPPLTEAIPYFGPESNSAV
jgi:hypothetical protein